MMEFFRSPDFRAVWTIRSRKLLSNVEFWLTLIGYDPKTHSFPSPIYLLYVVIFFSVWIFLVLLLIADFAGKLLNFILPGSPVTGAAAIGGLLLLGYFLLTLFSASRRSPFVFSETDATLICQTPADRRAVGLVWFLGDWIVQGPIFWAGAIVIGYALLEAQFGGNIGAQDLPRYFLAGLKMASIVLPIHLAAQSLAWTAGACRLHGKNGPAYLHWIAPVLLLAIIAGWAASTPDSGALLPGWAWLALYPFRAGLGAGSYLLGIGPAVALAILGLLKLALASRKMSLARAAQETRDQEAIQAASLFGSSDTAREMKQQKRLGAEKKSGRLPVVSDKAALLWRNIAQSRRSITFGQVYTWLGILGLSVAIFLIPDWGALALIMLYWMVLVGGQSIQHLRRDLSRWWLLHQLPYSSEEWVLMDLALPAAAIVLIGMLILAVTSQTGSPLPSFTRWLFIPAAIGAILASMIDILRQSHSDHLLVKNVPGQSLVSILLGALAIGIPGLLAWWLIARLSFSTWLAIPVMLLVSLGFDYVLYRWAGNLLRSIRQTAR